jgi:hypothetical protein
MRTLLKFIGITFFLLISSKNEMKADHTMGAEITYKMIDTLNGTYEFTLKRYRYCGGINFQNNNLHIVTDEINMFVPMTLIGSYTTEVTPLCLPPDVPAKKITHCPGPSISPLSPDFIKGTMQEILTCTHTIGRNKIGFVSYREDLRNFMNTINGNPPLVVVTAFNSTYVNNSVFFTNNPVPYWCKGRINTYAHGPSDSFDPKYITVNGQTVIRDSISFVRYNPFVAEHPILSVVYQLGSPGVSHIPP